MKKTYTPVKQLTTVSFGNKFSISTHLVRTIDGHEIEFYLRHADDCSIIIPLIDENTCIMVEQHRFGADKISLEFPSGSVQNKNPQEMAVIELEEECGYRSDSLEEIGSFYPSSGYSTEKMYVFLAKKLKEVGQKLEKFEYIELKTIPLADIPTLIKTGTIFDAHTIIAYYYLQQLR